MFITYQALDNINYTLSIYSANKQVRVITRNFSMVQNEVEIS